MNIIITVDNNEVEIDGNLSELGEDFKLAIVRRVFEREHRTCPNKSQAVLNTAAILDVDERYIWRLLKRWENKYVPNIKSN